MLIASWGTLFGALAVGQEICRKFKMSLGEGLCEIQVRRLRANRSEQAGTCVILRAVMCLFRKLRI